MASTLPCRSGHVSLALNFVLVLLSTSCASRQFISRVGSEADSGLIGPLIINGRVVDATSPYLEGTRFRNELAQANLGQPPQSWAEKKERFTEDLYLKGMDFIKKGPSGSYDTPFAVAVEPMAVRMERQWIDDYGQSAARWIVVCRAFLSEVYSNRQPTVAGIKRRLNLTDTQHDAAIQEVITRMTSSMYFIPGFVDPAMDSYPYLPITGWDAILSNFDKNEGFNFEVNAGTPSGISNLSALIEILKQQDRTQADLLKEYLGADNTFEQMRRVLEASARAWTGADGLSVVVSPGEYNGAHPDVASIAMLSGMPLVGAKDLFIGAEGDLQLRLAGGSSQRVTAIYSRMEESFLFQEGDRLSQGAIPMIQTWFDNASLGKRIGKTLREGVWYDYTTSGPGFNVTGVKLSASGEPLVSRLYSTPFDATPGGKTLRQLVLDRKVYANLIGGRVIDDKKIFQVIAAIARGLHPDALVAGPPETLADDNLLALRDEPEQYVVKRTDRSGGEGVYVLRNLNAERQNQVIEDVIQNRGEGFTVQRSTPSISQPTTYQRGSRWGFSQLLGDLRVFVFVGPDGQPFVGDRGFLYRIAPFDPRGDREPTPWSMPAANTSQGGGYGIVVVAGKPRPPAAENPVLWVSASSEQRLQEFATQVQLVKETLETNEQPNSAEL